MFSKKTCGLAMWSSEVVSVTAARSSVDGKLGLQKPSPMEKVPRNEADEVI